jgi:hypothetical protein
MPQEGETKKFFMEYGELGEDTFNTCTFKKQSHEEDSRVRIYWAWLSEDDEQWQAPDTLPKIHYAGVRALYKVYLINQIDQKQEATPSDTPSVHFAEDFMPVLTKALKTSLRTGDAEAAETAGETAAGEPQSGDAT